MRQAYSTALLAGLACLLGFAGDARALVTLDVVFQDPNTPSGIAIEPGDPGPGCAFGGYHGGSVPTGYCMDVMMYASDLLNGVEYSLLVVAFSVAYDSDNGLAVGSLREWSGIGVSFNKVGTLQKSCAPAGGVADSPVTAGVIQQFECLIPPPNDPPFVPPGTYRLGTIIWDTSGTQLGGDNKEVISAVLVGGDGLGIVYHGNLAVMPPPPVFGSQVLTIIPEPGTAALLGLGLVGLLLAARRRRSPSA